MSKIHIIVGVLVFFVLLVPASASALETGPAGVLNPASITDIYNANDLQPLAITKCDKLSGGTGCLAFPADSAAGPDAILLGSASLSAGLSTLLRVVVVDAHWQPVPPPPKLH